MPSKKTQLDKDSLGRVVAEIQRNRQQRKQDYREQALKLYPWICAKCGREFTGKRLRELTVHHKDHNHNNNPPDGSNWELLCLYCHDNEHSRYLDQEWYDDEATPDSEQETPSTCRPFAGLDALLKDKK
ncbi:MAG: YajD family HNH nuclease [Deltaproteobacteria bacterium]|nr:YajD family HNH nuclease [Deltaproteobacteria bacterium]